MALQVPVPWNESARLSRIDELRAVVKGDSVLDRLVRIAAAAVGMPLSLVTLVERDQQRCVAQAGGAPIPNLPREIALCAHAILSPGAALEVPDTFRDTRFAKNPLVTRPDGIRYYAGVPLTLPGDDFAVGALCVVDTRPHSRGTVDLETLALVAREVERHLADEQRANGAARAHELLSGLCIGAAVLEDGELSVNPALSRMTGYESRELRTLDGWFSSLFGDSAPVARQRYEAARARDFRIPSYDPIRRKDGVERTLEVCRSKVNGAEVWIVVDITTARDAQDALLAARDAAEESARATSAFLQTMSHELRTPMNGVFGMTDALLHTELTPAQREYAETVRAQSEVLVRVLDDVLDYTELEAHRVLIQQEPFSPRSVLEDACHSFVDAAARKRLSLVVDTAGVEESALGDAARIRQLLGCIVSNAVKFTDHGEVVVKASTEPCADGKILLRVTVGDTGIGITSEVHDRLFAPFMQGDSSPARRYGGLGLGLAVARAIAFLMGGELTLESEVGRGTTVTVSVVLSESTRMPVQWERRFNGRRVLVVGDGTPMDAVAASLAAFGAHVQRSATAAQDAPPCDVWFVAEEALSAPTFDDLESLPPVVVVEPTARTLPAREHPLALRTPLRQQDVASLMLSALEGGRAGAKRAEKANAVPSGHALVVDDNAVNVKVAVAMLGRLGWTADVAENGAEAVRAASARRYDVVLMDCQMPVLDGYAATIELRSLKKTADAFVVALTANALAGDRERCMTSGMNDFLSKPLRPPELVRVLREAVARRK